MLPATRKRAVAPPPVHRSPHVLQPATLSVAGLSLQRGDAEVGSGYLREALRMRRQIYGGSAAHAEVRLTLWSRAYSRHVAGAVTVGGRGCDRM